MGFKSRKLGHTKLYCLPYKKKKKRTQEEKKGRLCNMGWDLQKWQLGRLQRGNKLIQIWILLLINLTCFLLSEAFSMLPNDMTSLCTKTKDLTLKISSLSNEIELLKNKVKQHKTNDKIWKGKKGWKHKSMILVLHFWNLLIVKSN